MITNSHALESSNLAVKQLLRTALETRWRTYHTELERCQSEFTNDAVHDLRVATRRILALIKLLDSISPRPRYEKMRRAFKKQLDTFDKLRDTQVILAGISKTLGELPQLQGFQEHMQSRETKLMGALGKKIKKFDTSTLDRRIQKTQKDIESKINGDAEVQVMQVVDDAFSRVQRRINKVDLSNSATIHRVRIAFKAFRYMLEIVHPLVKDFPEKNFKKMNAYQTLMGEIQDTEVFLQTFTDFSERASVTDLGPVRRYYERRHTDAIDAYASRMDQVNLFWRPAPDQPFPWTE